ncbi:hypothetical protein KDA_53230 [Dictyobacter alpinus]|uniref:Uncharacterized protein n=1 Tax=Dictyobacter alpinus TaxID=2014873 RepID=A0A402BET6_9CHLR|nr:hypothetical protein [Dictyobacter alpinus]GCE29839.1 hypothetical protein KDA_53230 [Dictyobacter alpinus]
MIKDSVILATPYAHQPPSLYICSNGAASKTPWRPYWQQHLTALQQEAVPFQFMHSATPPTLLLNTERHLRLPALLEKQHDPFDYWPFWSTFMTDDQHLSDTFLFLSISSHENYWLTLRFDHRQHLACLQQIEQENRLVLAIEPQRVYRTVTFDAAELTRHLNEIKRVRGSGQDLLQ